MWTYGAGDSIRHNAIAIGGGRFFLVDRPLELVDRLRPGERLKASTTAPAEGKLLALDARTGKVLWKHNKDIYGTLPALSVEHNVLLMAYQVASFRLNSERGWRMTAFSASTGERLWDMRAGYSSRPVINGRTIYAQPVPIRGGGLSQGA